MTVQPLPAACRADAVKCRGVLIALDRCDPAVPAGELRALLGSYGTGKRAALGLPLGLFRASSGRARSGEVA